MPLPFLYARHGKGAPLHQAVHRSKVKPRPEFHKLCQD